MAQQNFTRVSIHYRCLCEETKEEQTFPTEKSAANWSQKVVDTFGARLTFTITRVVESARTYTRDRFEREEYVLLEKKPI